MQKFVREYLEPYLQDEHYENEMRQFLQEYDKLIMYSPTCLLCGGFGHESDMKCGFVKTFIKAFRIMRQDAEVNQLKREWRFLLKNQNRFESGLHKQQMQSENNEGLVKREMLQDDSLEGSNQKAKKLANKLKRKQEQAHKMAINTSDCLLEQVEQHKAVSNPNPISKNYRKRRFKCKVQAWMIPDN